MFTLVATVSACIKCIHHHYPGFKQSDIWEKVICCKGSPLAAGGKLKHLVFRACDRRFSTKNHLHDVPSPPKDLIPCRWDGNLYTVNQSPKDRLFYSKEGLLMAGCIVLVTIWSCVSDKDVTRTDRTHEFFSGDDNPNIQVLYDILMTYCMYNFDLGEYWPWFYVVVISLRDN